MFNEALCSFGRYVHMTSCYLRIRLRSVYTGTVALQGGLQEGSYIFVRTSARVFPTALGSPEEFETISGALETARCFRFCMALTAQSIGFRGLRQFAIQAGSSGCEMFSACRILRLLSVSTTLPNLLELSLKTPP